MRKGQEKLLNDAKQWNFSDAIMEFLSDESVVLKDLQRRYAFCAHYQYFDGNTKTYEELSAFYVKLQDEYSKKFQKILHLNFQDIEYYEHEYENILQLKEKYESNEYDFEKIIKILSIVIRAEVSIHEAEEFIRKREEEEEKGTVGDFWIAFKCIYTNTAFENFTLDDKLNVELISYENNLLKNVVLDDNDACGTYYSVRSCCHKINYFYKLYILDKTYPGMKELCFKETVSKSGNEYIKNRIEYLWEEDKINYLKNSLSIFPDTYITISGSPYSIEGNISVSGISIKYEGYSHYIGRAYNKITDSEEIKIPVIKIENLTISKEFLFMFDGNCFFKVYGKYRPATLKDFSHCYFCDALKQIIHIYIEHWIRKGAYVWKDIEMYLDRKEIPPIKVNDMCHMHSKKEMMNSCYKNADYFNWNKIDLFYGYIALKSMKLVNEGERSIIKDYICKTKTDNFPKLCSRSYNDMAEEFLKYIIFARLTNKGDDESVSLQVIKDYIHMAKLSKIKITLKAKSINRILELHDQLLDMQKLKSIPVIKVPNKSKFNRLRKLLPEEFEWITNKRRLYKEGNVVHHCVACYADEINNDTSAIYSFLYKGNQRRYTIEFNLNQNGSYKIKQMHGLFNEDAPTDTWDYVMSFLNEKQLS